LMIDTLKGMVMLAPAMPIALIDSVA